MNKHSITVTIDGIPEHLLRNLWNYAIREAKKDFGVNIKQVDTVRIDFTTLMEYEQEETFPAMVSNITTIAAVQECQKQNIKAVKN